MAKFSRTVWLSLLALVSPSVLAAQARIPEGQNKTPKEFIEGFYQWYVPLSFKENATTASDAALKLKRQAFSRQLFSLLRQDSTAQAACGELIGLDFDPFLNTQEPSERYEVGPVAKTGETYRADVYRVERGQRSEKPDVTVEVAQRNGRWVFVDFDYPDGQSLVSVLRSPRPKCTVPRASSRK